MEAVTRKATRLARADHALIGEAAEGRIRWLAASGCPLVPEGPPISRELPSGRAILDCQTTQVEDVTELTEDFPGVRRAFDEFGVRTILATPLVREGLSIGVLLVRRTTRATVHGQGDRAPEDLCRPGGDRDRERPPVPGAAGAERGAGGGAGAADGDREILRVIASSPTDLQPVMEAVAENAARVCGATDSAIFRLEGEHLRLVALHGPLRRSMAIGEAIPVSRGTVGGRVVRDRRTIHVEDIMAAEAEFPETVSRMRQRGSARPDIAGDAAAARGRAAGRYLHQSGARGPALLGQADRAPRDLRQSGRDRHRERPAVHGTQEKNRAITRPMPGDRVPRAADGDGRDPAGDRELADRPPAGAGRHGPERSPAVRGR